MSTFPYFKIWNYLSPAKASWREITRVWANGTGIFTLKCSQREFDPDDPTQSCNFPPHRWRNWPETHIHIPATSGTRLKFTMKRVFSPLSSSMTLRLATENATKESCSKEQEWMHWGESFALQASLASALLARKNPCSQEEGEGHGVKDLVPIPGVTAVWKWTKSNQMRRGEGISEPAMEGESATTTCILAGKQGKASCVPLLWRLFTGKPEAANQKGTSLRHWLEEHTWF